MKIENNRSSRHCVFPGCGRQIQIGGWIVTHDLNEDAADHLHHHPRLARPNKLPRSAWPQPEPEVSWVVFFNLPLTTSFAAARKEHHRNSLKSHGDVTGRGNQAQFRIIAEYEKIKKWFDLNGPIYPKDAGTSSRP